MFSHRRLVVHRWRACTVIRMVHSWLTGTARLSRVHSCLEKVHSWRDGTQLADRDCTVVPGAQLPGEGYTVVQVVHSWPTCTVVPELHSYPEALWGSSTRTLYCKWPAGFMPLPKKAL